MGHGGWNEITASGAVSEEESQGRLRQSRLQPSRWASEAQTPEPGFGATLRTRARLPVAARPAGLIAQL